jgi:hypothetical protein
MLCSLATGEEDAGEWLERGARMIIVNAPALMAERLRGMARSVKRAPTGAG